ncbi:MAG: peptidyl-prolyl cis-trans isomerase [Acidobacteria bacterium]|nr:peptidyl-prolyl cis-trans isomerase [Acidobacteriota bacterium]
MLKFFSRLEKTRNFVLLLIGVVMILGLVVGIGSSNLFSPNTTSDGLSTSTEAIAKVGSEKVTVGEIARIKQGRMSSLPTKMMVNSLVQQRIIRVEAMRLGFRASDGEVANLIREQNKSPDGTPLDIKRYEQWAVQNFGSVAEYEQTVRDQISGEKLEAFLTSGVVVSEEEILKDFQRKNTKFDVSYVSVNAAELAQTIKPTDAELSEYFEKNKANYYISSAQKKIRYVFLNTAKVGEKSKISDDDLKAEYEKIPADKKKKGVEGQQIVLRIAKPDFETKVMEKATEVVDRAKKDGKITEEAFTELVNGYSEDAASKARGGKLAGLVRENPNKPTDPYQRLLTMQEGDVTEPIKEGSSVYILRRGRDVPKTFEDAKPELEISLRNRRGYTAAAELAQRVFDDLKQSKDAAATAKKFAAEANMGAGEMVRETPFVKPGDNVENIGKSPQFEEGIKNLENANDVGEKIPIQNGFAIPLLVEKKEPRDATLDEVRDQIAESVKLDKARAQVEEIAKQIASGAANAGALSGAAQSKGLKALDQKSFILGSPLGTGPSASTNEALEDAVFGLKIGEVTKTPLLVGDSWYIVGVNKREDANMDDFAKQRDSLVQTMAQQKRSQLFSDYLAAVRQKMETNGEIKIYNDAIERLDAAMPPSSPQMPGGFQFPQQ